MFYSYLILGSLSANCIFQNWMKEAKKLEFNILQGAVPYLSTNHFQKRLTSVIGKTWFFFKGLWEGGLVALSNPTRPAFSWGVSFGRWDHISCYDKAHRWVYKWVIQRYFWVPKSEPRQWNHPAKLPTKERDFNKTLKKLQRKLKKKKRVESFLMVHNPEIVTGKKRRKNNPGTPPEEINSERRHRSRHWLRAQSLTQPKTWTVLFKISPLMKVVKG